MRSSTAESIQQAEHAHPELLPYKVQQTCIANLPQYGTVVAVHSRDSAGGLGICNGYMAAVDVWQDMDNFGAQEWTCCVVTTSYSPCRTCPKAIITNGKSSTCLDAGSSSPIDGTLAHIYACFADYPAQQWLLPEQVLNGSKPEKPFQIFEAASGLCLDTVGQGVGEETQINMWHCRNIDEPTKSTDSQLWQVRTANPKSDGSGTVTTIQHVASGKCLDLLEAQTSDKTPVSLYDCLKDYPSQQWTVQAVQA